MTSNAISSEQLNKFRELGKSWLLKAENAKSRAFEEIEKINYSEAVSASLDAIEFSIKAIFLFYGFKFPKIHKIELEIEEKEHPSKLEKQSKEALDKLEEILKKLPNDYEKTRMKKSFFYFKFWGEFHTLVKYGSDRLGLGPEKLFGKKEAQLALDHVIDCVSIAQNVRSQLKLF